MIHQTYYIENETEGPVQFTAQALLTKAGLVQIGKPIVFDLIGDVTAAFSDGTKSITTTTDSHGLAKVTFSDKIINDGNLRASISNFGTATDEENFYPERLSYNILVKDILKGTYKHHQIGGFFNKLK